ncbi:roquin-2-like [Xyrauchen texanus]|uniref:roquin-2-like n=1 Tax=Xyrauchen texanus TaxID=154827 RepID=UPI0022425AD5|nr:roquin-2-like [Xyrauchen texanus]XP_051971856.1 roquin-2-like [Xyrauchen texanus]
MPVQAAQWTEFLSCPICYNEFDASCHKPISLGCSHTVCKTCLHKLHRKACPFDQTAISTDIDMLPVNCALLQLVGALVPEGEIVNVGSVEDTRHYEVCRMCVEELALYLKHISGGKGVVNLSQCTLSRPMQRKLVTLVNCQLVEEEGRMRAIRACRSLGERTITELILQHQNPQQLSANLWAAVRARGCQFLGPAMQEDALKLVLLALEDGSALSRKVLVLFVVQKLEARFPQASKTSIGHVVQLLYRASCFKVTKRDEDSSLMQLKEEFRTYDALRREHDAQIVHIAMEAGLRISPEQWSSLLYGDLIHKSHMQSIIDKLQSPESFGKSVQELIIILQRTEDPANLNSLRARLERLANIDYNPDATTPSWAELESVLLAVKVVVHGLVEFIQNFSKKSHDSPQAQPNTKYKTSMCRDLRQQGGCPRGASCTFAHTQDELEKYRMRNRKASGVVRPFLSVPAVMPKVGTKEVGSEVGTEVLKNNEEVDPTSEDSSPTQLIPRGGEHQDEQSLPNCANGLPDSSLEQNPVSHLVSLVSREECCGPPKHGSVQTRAHHEIYYSHDQRSHYDLPPHQPAIPSYKSCNTRFLRSSNVAESMLPPSLGPLYPDQHPSVPPPDRLGPAHYGPPSTYTSISHSHSHGVYTPVYDSRRAWRPPLYPRDGGRSNSLPPEVFHSSVCQPPLRERYNSLDSPYCCAAEQRAAVHRDSYAHVHLGYEDLYRHKQEQWAHHHGNVNRPSQSSPVFTVDLCPEHPEGVVGGCMTCKCHGGEENLAQYTPWSCGTISPFESEPHHLSSHSCSKQSDGESGGKRWLHMFEHYRRLKDEDPIIPFGEGPIISKWGAISRASRTGYHTDPVQATALQGSAGTTSINFRDYGSHIGHIDHRWGPRGADSTSHSSYQESDHLAVPGLHVQSNSLSSWSKQSSELLGKYGTESQPDRNIELELSTLDMEDTETQDSKPEDSLETQSHSHLSSVFSQPVAQSQMDNNLPDRMDTHHIKKMAFRKTLSPGGLSIGKMPMRTCSPRPREPPGPEMLLNGT